MQSRVAVAAGLGTRFSHKGRREPCRRCGVMIWWATPHQGNSIVSSATCTRASAASCACSCSSSARTSSACSSFRCTMPSTRAARWLGTVQGSVLSVALGTSASAACCALGAITSLMTSKARSHACEVAGAGRGGAVICGSGRTNNMVPRGREGKQNRL